MPDSKFFIQGASNVAGFTCGCSPYTNEINTKISIAHNLVVLTDALIKIPTKSIDCHNPVYNYNLRDCLDFDHFPWITLNVVYIQLKKNSIPFRSYEWMELYSNMIITIQNKQILQEINCKGIEYQKNHFRIQGTHAISLKDYDIKVPSLMFGMVHIKDAIHLEFDLRVQWIP